jgi:hypothetical protein
VHCYITVIICDVIVLQFIPCIVQKKVVARSSRTTCGGVVGVNVPLALEASTDVPMELVEESSSVLTSNIKKV